MLNVVLNLFKVNNEDTKNFTLTLSAFKGISLFLFPLKT